MSSEEIIEYEGRRFVRTGERRFPKKGEWLFAEGCQRPIFSDHNWVMLEREILRELPAETPACHFPFIPGKTPNGQDKIPRTCAKCGAYPVASWEDNHGLLAEAEEAISRLIGMVVTMQNLHGDHITKFIIDSQPFNWAQSVLARIRAAKEKP